MKGSDKILWLIVGAVIVLVIVAFASVLLRPQPEYVPDDNPEGVVHNYLLALRQGDYERAYAYLSAEIKAEDLDDFIDTVEQNSWKFQMGSNIALSIEDSTVSRDNSAKVNVRKNVTYNELLGSSQQADTFPVFLRQENGEWRIYKSRDYWDYCWDEDSSCR